MKQGKVFLYKLGENINSIIKKTNILFFIIVILFSLADEFHNNNIYTLAMIISTLTIFYIIFLSYYLSIVKEKNLNIKDFIRNVREHIRELYGFILCTFFSILIWSVSIWVALILIMLPLNL